MNAMSHESGLLWRLEFDHSRISFLFGTIHLNSSLFQEKRELFNSLLNQCVIFAAEVDLDQMNPDQMSAFFKLPENGQWLDQLKPNQWLKMKQLCERRFHLDLNQFTTVFPLVLVNQISLQLIGMNAEKSLDQNLWELAAQKNMSRMGLEDFHQHFNMISLIELKDQIKMLKDLLKNLDHSKRKYVKMVNDYHSQDLRSIYQTSRKMLGKYRKLMLFERNEIMRDKIMQLGQTESCFITCGAGHLYGEQGILRLLKKQGVSLKHVSL